MAKKTDSPRNLLITRFSALGDVAMTIPVIYSVCRCNPSTRFVMVTRKAMAPMFVNPPENLIVKGVDLKTDYVGTRGLWRLASQLCHDYHIDGIADLHGVLRTYAIDLYGRLHGIPCHSIRKGRKGKRALTRPTNKVMLPLTSSIDRYREVFYRFGLKMDHCFQGLFGPHPAQPAAYATITEPKAASEKWIGVAPFAKHKGKIYPIEQMEQVVNALAALPNTRIFLFGAGPEEQAVLGRWAESHPNVMSLAAKRYGFPAELALMSCLDTMLTMDSGNMHLASLVGTRVISVWGATHPYCGFKGYHQKDADIIQLPMTCRPCSVFGNKPCSRGDYYCLAGIAPKIIVAKVKAVLGIND